ncbi:beta-galactosidase GalA [Bacteroides uniformis]|uniref:beta-galactosidase GalA n=1 Tax=Bacteroides uniformis TaxID=820 RepID=UPI001E4B67F0|nr:beta-galactosidase GalA [Bacteroides uniformis]
MMINYKNLLSLFFCTVLLCGLSVAQEKVTFREVLSLDKGWRFHKGDIPYPIIKGHNETYRNAKAGRVSGAASTDYDDTSWRMLDLPHDWAIEGRVDSTANLSQGYYHRGFGWYRRKFRLSPEDKGKHLELQFDGISTHATIWVNGTVLHRNWCGYTSMYIDITPYATYGDNLNTIAVRVDADAQEGWWYEGAGIYRHTWLVKRSPLHIITDGVFAHPVKKENGQWEIPAEISLYNSGKLPAEGEVEVSLYAPDGSPVATRTTRLTVEALQENIAGLKLPVANPELWSPDIPALYKVKSVVRQNGKVMDEVTTHCGFRTIRFDKDTGFWLNGENIKIKGVCNHQDHAGVGVAVPDALWEFRLRKLKEMGVNAYRPAHNPMSKEFMAACDSMGIMVLDENRLFNTSPEYVRQLQWLVRRDRNCPSVILWSVFNEEPMQGTENGYEMVRRMCAVVKDMDTTRPVTAAMNGGFFAEHNVSQAVDVGGFNYQIGSYDRFHAKSPELPLVSSEDGSAFMVRGEYKTDKSRNIIDAYDSEATGWGATHRRAWKEVATRPWMAGCFYWTGFDYHGEPTPFQWPSVSSFFGIMDLCGFPKSAYYLHQAQWRKDKPVLELIPHWNWPADSIGKPIKVMAFSNADRVKLLLNGKTVSEQQVDSFEMNTWLVPYKPGRLEAIGYKNGKVVSRAKVETTKEPVRVKLTPYRNSLVGDGRDAMPITVEMVDSKGRHVPTANNMIEFSIDGPAKIIGLGNGNPNCHEPEKGNKRSLFNGLAQVIIQTEEGLGEVTLTATAPGIKPANLTIPVNQVELAPFVAVEKPIMILDKWLASPFSKDRPDVNRRIADNDMNTWEAMAASSAMFLENASYVVCHTEFTLPEDYRKDGGVIQFKNLAGKAEVWLNGKLIGSKDMVDERNFQVEFPATEGKCELRVLLNSSPNTHVGLKGSVTVQGK